MLESLPAFIPSTETPETSILPNPTSIPDKKTDTPSIPENAPTIPADTPTIPADTTIAQDNIESQPPEPKIEPKLEPAVVQSESTTVESAPETAAAPVPESTAPSASVAPTVSAVPLVEEACSKAPVTIFFAQLKIENFFELLYYFFFQEAAPVPPALVNWLEFGFNTPNSFFLF